MTTANEPFRPLIKKLPSIALATYIGLFALPIPVAVSILPLLVASLALSLDSRAPKLSFVVSIKDLRATIVLVFSICHVLSVLFSQNPLKSTQSTMLFLPGLLVVFLTFSMPAQQSAKLTLIRGIATCIAVVSSLYFLTYLADPDKNPTDILASLNSNALIAPNDLSIGLILMPFLILGLSLEKNVLLKPFYWLALLLFITVVGISGSRLCIAGTALLVTLIFGAKQKRLWLVPLILLLGLLILSAIDLAIKTGIIYKLSHLAEYNGRLSVWYVGLTQWTEKPWLGVGPAGYEAVHRQVRSSDLIPQWMFIDPRMITWAHSLVVEALLERGMLGLFALLALGFALFRVFLQRACKGKFDFNMAIFLSYIMFVVIGSLELTLQRNWVVIILCLYIGLYLSDSLQRQNGGVIDRTKNRE